MTLHPDRRTYDPAVLTLALIVALTAANAFFNVLATTCGLGGHYGSFLFGPSDLFGDFFKVVRSYGDGVADWLPRLPEPAEGGFDPKEALATPGLHPHETHYELPPLSTLLSVLTLGAGKAMPLAWLFAGYLLLLLVYLVRICRLAPGARAPWLAASLLSYPLLMMWTRGNLYAGLTALCLLHALLLAARGRAPLLAAFCLAVAINIRPNAIVFALPLLAFQPKARVRVALVLAMATMGLWLGTLAIVQAIYPAYDMPTFLAGVERYHLRYVVEDDGLAFGSSLYGMLKLVLEGGRAAEVAGGLVAAGLLAAGGAAFSMGRLRRAPFLFLVCAAYCLGSAAFGDYHLLPFLAVPMVAAIDGERIDLQQMRVAIAPASFAAAMMLAPKAYLFVGDVSVQVLLNPLLLLAGAVQVLRAAATEKGRPVAGPPLPWSEPRPAPG